MKVVDTHCHVSPFWYEPVESLLFHMDRSGVGHAVLVQYGGQFDNSYQHRCVARYPGRFTTIVVVDTNSPQATVQLEHEAARGARGIRLRPESRSPGTDPLAIWRTAEALGLVVSCSGTKEQFSSKAFSSLVQAVPDLPIILEHLGSVNHPEDEPAPFAIRRQVFDLARFPNIYCKVHGIGEICRRTATINGHFPFDPERLEIFEMAFRAFGAHRLMWGSDYPPVSGREGYHNALQLPLEYLHPKGEDAIELIFGAVARRLFGLGNDEER